MSATCERILGRLPEYGREALPQEERRAVREHLTSCAACRTEAAAADPVLLFSALPPESVSAEDVATVVASVRAGMALRQAERRIERPSGRATDGRVSRRSARVAAAAAVLLLTLALPFGPNSPKAPSPALVAGPSAADARLSTAAGPSGPAGAGAGATVYDFNPGAGEPRVVWIVDGSLDI
jgi:anti-sigma factor RsiW